MVFSPPRQRSLISTFVWPLLLVLSVSCTKKRKDQFVQNNGDKTPIGEICKGNHSFTAVKKKQDYFSTTAEESTDHKNEANVYYPVVYYTSTLDLLPEGLDIRGKVGETYPVRCKLEGEWLKVFKIANESNISSDEKTFSEKEDKEYWVPLVGYPVQYYKVEHVIDGNGRSTHQLKDTLVKNRAEATHVDINKNGRKLFEAIVKTDVLPANMLSGEWYYSETIINTSYGKEGSIGYSSGGLDSEKNLSSKIKFLSREKSVVAVNLGVDPKLANESAIKLYDVITIPVERKSYKVPDEDGTRDFREEEDNSINPLSRPYMKMLWSGTFSQKSGGSGSGSGNLVDKYISHDYFTFVVEKNKKQVRYSFYRVEAYKKSHPEYEAKPYYRSDKTKFGYFYVEPKTVDIQKTEKDVASYINRFNPKLKTIDFYFTKSSLKEDSARDVVQKAIDHWESAFRAAGSQIKLNLVKNKEVDLGDIRYNTINLMDSVSDNQRWVGLGPVVVDSNTGEIIASTSNIDVYSIRKDITESIIRYIWSELGLRKGSTQYIGNLLSASSMSHASGVKSDRGDNLDVYDSIVNGFHLTKSDVEQMAADSSKINDSSMEAINRYQYQPFYSAIEEINGKKLSSYDQAVDEFLKLSKQDSKLSQVQFKHESAANQLGIWFPNKIKKQCEEVNEFISQNKGTDQFPDNIAKEQVVISCANKLLHVRLLEVTVHELGHNFGLLHNFYGSADGDHFFTKNQFVDIYKDETEESYEKSLGSSSVMDYPHPEVSIGIYPGPYDIAAIRFSYQNEVETKNGGVVSVGNGETIDSVLNSVGSSERIEYKFCTDFHLLLNKDPMCNKFDRGTTDLEALKFTVLDLDRTVLNTTERKNRSWTRETEKQINLYRIGLLKRIARFYYKWRRFLYESNGSRDPSLKDHSFTSYTGYDISERAKILLDRSDVDLMKSSSDSTTLLGKIKSRQKSSDSFDELIQVRNLAFQTLKKYAFYPNKYCVAKDSTGKVYILELERLRYELGSHKFNCEDSVVQDQMSLYYFGKKSELVSFQSVGLELNSVKFNSKNINSDLDPVDIVGMSITKEAASAFLTHRNKLRFEGKENQFEASILDEPDLNRDYLNSLMGRILHGVDLRGWLDADNYPLDRDDRFAQFYYEQSLLKDQYLQYIKEKVKLKNVNYKRDKELMFFTVLTTDEYRLAVKMSSVIAKAKGRFYVPLMDGISVPIRNIVKRFNDNNALSDILNLKAGEERETLLTLFDMLSFKNYLHDNNNQELTVDTLAKMYIRYSQVKEKNPSNFDEEYVSASVIVYALKPLTDVWEELGFKTGENEIKVPLHMDINKKLIERGEKPITWSNIIQRVDEHIDSLLLKIQKEVGDQTNELDYQTELLYEFFINL